MQVVITFWGCHRHGNKKVSKLEGFLLKRPKRADHKDFVGTFAISAGNTKLCTGNTKLCSAMLNVVLAILDKAREVMRMLHPFLAPPKNQTQGKFAARHSTLLEQIWGGVLSFRVLMVSFLVVSLSKPPKSRSPPQKKCPPPPPPPPKKRRKRFPPPPQPLPPKKKERKKRTPISSHYAQTPDVAMPSRL